MAYNPNTRLLLKFNNGAGSTASDDTSSYARYGAISGGEVSSAAGVFSSNSVVLGDPFGSGSVGDVTVSAVSTLFSTSPTSNKRVDLWFRPEAYPPWGNSPLFSLAFQNGDTLVVWYSSTSLDVEYNGTATDSGHYLYQQVAFYPTQSQWYHFRLAISGDTLKMGLDGAETHSIIHTANVWTGVSGNPITAFRLGAWPSAFGSDANSFLRGYLDAVEFLDGDTSWFGGSYTVPTAEPDDYTSGGPVEIFGTGLVTLDDMPGFGAGEMPVVEGNGLATLEDVTGDGYGSTMAIIEGAGLATLDALTGTGDGIVLPVVSGDGLATLDAVTGSGFGGGPDLNTRLMLHFDIPNSSKDSSLYNRTISLVGSVGTMQVGSPAKFGDGYISYGTASEVGSALGVQLGTTLFDNPATSKNIDFFFQLNSVDGYRPLFQIAFAGGYYIDAVVTPFYDLMLEVATPNAFGVFGEVLNAFQFVGWKHINIAFVGDTIYLGINGNQVWSHTCAGGPAWPQANAATAFVIGNYATPQVGGAARGSFDHFRVIEADGWAGGTYTVPSYAWYPGMKLGTGVATLEGVTSTADGIVRDGAEGVGFCTLDDIGRTSYGNVAWIGTGQAQLEDITGYGDNFPLWLGQGLATLDNATSQADGAVAWVFYGTGLTTIEAVTGSGAGGSAVVIIDGEGLATLTSITSSAGGTVSVSGTGSAIIDGLTGYGDGFTFAGQGLADLADMTGSGQGAVLVAGTGLATLDAMPTSGLGISGTFGAGYVDLTGITSLGAGQIIVSGAGLGWLGDIVPPYWIPDVSHVVKTKQQEMSIYVK